jgi:prophage maintenance system killer protein
MIIWQRPLITEASIERIGGVEKMKILQNSNIEIFKLDNGKTEIKVKLDQDTVWLNMNQLSELFERDKSVISRHINNIFKERELIREAVVAKNATTALDGKSYQLDFYNLDVIISIGYRIKSKRGTDFRIWANKVLTKYLVDGYALNDGILREQKQQLKELQKSVKLLRDVLNDKHLAKDESSGLLKIISDYAYALDILDQYDYQQLDIKETSGKETYQLTYSEAMEQIRIAREAYGNSNLFGNEKDDSFKSSIYAIYQTFDGKDVYPSIEEKAAHLLYFITKNHSFTDGNKRIAAFLFLYFLHKNSILYDSEGNKRIADNTLVAITLMIAVSNPDEKETMVKVVVNLINKHN